MGMSFWQIESLNVTNRKLAELLDEKDAAVMAALRAACEAESVPFAADDPKGSFKNLFMAVSYRTDVKVHPTADSNWRREARENHDQTICEQLAKQILADAGRAKPCRS